MKTKLLFLFAFLFVLHFQAQTFSKSIQYSILENSEVKLNDIAKGSPLLKDYIIEATKTDFNYLEVTLKSDDESKSFKIYPLSFDLFSAKFKNTFLDLIAKVEHTNIDRNATKFDKSQISLLFAQLITFERTEDERPLVANITLKKDIPVLIKYKAYPSFEDYLKNDNEKPIKEQATKKVKKQKRDSFVQISKISDAKLELTFFNGFIEKIELEAVIKDELIRFTNVYSVGISSSNGIKNFAFNNISSFYTYKLKEDKLIRDINGSHLIINLADIIDYDREIDVNANDISPEPTKLLLDKNQMKAKLYKEESTKLFEAIVYSDFLGVFDEENPNGIIQTEVSKKFYINTHRYQITKKGRFMGFIFPPIAFSEGYGWFEYVKINAKLSKIEENNKFLSPDTLNGVSFFSPLRIMQQQSFSIGGDINLLYLENQNKKVNTNLDIGIRYGRTGLQIDENTQEFYNSITTTAELGFQFIPEKRYGFFASIKVLYFQVYNDDGFIVKSIMDSELVKPNQWFNKTQFEFFVNTSTTGKLFIRYNLITELEDWDNNFAQFQFGYSFYLLKQNGKSK